MSLDNPYDLDILNPPEEMYAQPTLEELMALSDMEGEPAYNEPDFVQPRDYGFADRLALSLQGFPQYEPVRGESGGSAFGRGLIGGLAQGYSRSGVQRLSREEQERNAENARRQKVAERNYDRARAQYDRRQRVVDAITAEGRRENATIRAEQRSAGRADANDPMVVLSDADVAKYMGQPIGTRVKQSAYLTAQGGLRQAAAAQRAADAAVKAAAKASGMSKDQVTAIGTLTDNVRTDPDVKDFVTVRDNFERMREMAKSNSGAGDLSIIFAYMKVLDPTSVVREAEYNNAAQAVGKLPQLANIPRRWVSGKLLTPEGRRGFISAAERLYKTKETQYRRAVDMYGRQADAYGIPRDLVMRDFAAVEQPKPVAKPAAPPPGLAPPDADGVVRRVGGR